MTTEDWVTNTGSFTQQAAEAAGLTAAKAAPKAVGGTAVGTVDLDTPLLGPVGKKAADAALQESHDKLADERRALEILNQTGAKVAAELDLDKLVQTVVDAGVELTGAQFGAFFYNVERDDGERLMLYALSGAKMSDCSSRCFRTRIAESPSRPVWR